nr:hypothetical protein [Bartonella saheliensis]
MGVCLFKNALQSAFLIVSSEMLGGRTLCAGVTPSCTKGKKYFSHGTSRSAAGSYSGALSFSAFIPFVFFGATFF